MEGEDSELEESFPYRGRRWLPGRAGLVEGPSDDTTRWMPRQRPARNGGQSVTPGDLRPGSDNPRTPEIPHRGYRGSPAASRDCGGTQFTARVTEFTKKTAIRADSGGHESRPETRNTQKTFAPSSQSDSSVLHEAGAHRTTTSDGPEGMTAPGDSPPLAELCAGTVALCSLFYIRLKKERRLRESERRRRVFHYRRCKARERFRFAAMWASGMLAGEEPPSDESSREGQMSRVWKAAIDKAFSRFDWMENFRMTKPTFDFLCNQLRPVVQRTDAAAVRPAIPLEVRLAVTLWHLGSSCDFQTMEKIFGLARSTICTIIHDVCEVVASILTPKLISVPKGGPLQETLRGFERRYGLAQVAGVIGTLHVAIGSPNQSAGQFYNTKGWHSVVLQAVVDPDFCFWDLNVGCPGSLSDSQVLVASELYEQGTEGTLFPNTTKNVNGVEVPIHLLGSRSYPLLPWLMTPITKESNVADVELNRRFTSALTLTQIAFGRLKSRWRCLVRCSDVDLPFLPILVTACCTLHNICEGRREPFEDHWLEEASEEELEQPSEVEEDDMETEGAAEEIRTALASGVRI